MVRKIISYILLAALVAAVSFAYTHPKNKIVAKFASYTPWYQCKTPLKVSIARIDPQFKISKDGVAAALQKATGLWESAAHVDLFMEGEGGLPISLIYDERQKETDELKTLSTIIDIQKQDLTANKQNYEELQKTYLLQKNQYTALIAEFGKLKTEFNAKAALWNKNRSHSKEEYDSLKDEEQKLKNLATIVEEKRMALNSTTDALNKMAEALNFEVNKINEYVADFNTSGGSIREEFEAGLYRQDGLDRAIDIYQFEDASKLVAILAHELGHALGIGHIEDPSSIMYRLNKDQNQAISKYDLEALFDACPHLESTL